MSNLGLSTNLFGKMGRKMGNTGAGTGQKGENTTHSTLKRTLFNYYFVQM